MKKFIIRTLATVGALYLVSLIALGIWAWKKSRKGDVPTRTILVVTLPQPPVEDRSDDVAAHLLGGAPPLLRDVLFALEKASHDSRVVGVLMQGTSDMGIAQVQELRDAVVRFRATGKFAIAFADTFGEFGPGMKEYYLASAFGEIWLQPSGDIGLTGVAAEVPFLRGTLDKLGIIPRLDHRQEYKNAMNQMTERKFTPAHREATAAIVESVFSQMVRGIADGRHLSVEQVRALVDQGPLLGSEAFKAHLVDRLAYRDEVMESVKTKAGSGAEFLAATSYLERAGRPFGKGKTIALIYGLGQIARGESSQRALLGAENMGADTMARAFRTAVKDPHVKAILFRVDSPGGSYVASDTIWRETLRAKKAGKPVIVSMGNIAGSGGYFVAMGADKIVAEPGTLTGSIGVFGGKAVVSGLSQKVGLSWDEVHVGARATLWSTNRDYSPSEWARVQDWLDRVYVDFTSKVAEGRNLPKQKVLDVAKGRVWTGEDAKARGLVDALGGIDVALGLAKKAAGIPESEEIKLALFPPRKRAIAEVLDRLLGREEEEDAENQTTMIRSWAATLARFEPVVGQLSALFEKADGQVLRMGDQIPR